MKKLILMVLLLLVCVCGCGAEKTLETEKTPKEKLCSKAKKDCPKVWDECSFHVDGYVPEISEYGYDRDVDVIEEKDDEIKVRWKETNWSGREHQDYDRNCIEKGYESETMWIKKERLYKYYTLAELSDIVNKNKKLLGIKE